MVTGARPWDTDRALDDGIARAVVRRLFRSVDAEALTWVGAGWDFDVYRSGDWAVRFPRRAAYGRRAWEVPLLRLVGPGLESLGIRVPVPLEERIAEDLFPYHVTLHRWVPGRDAATLGHDAGLAMLPTLGRALRLIHDTPRDACRALGLPNEEWLMRDRLRETRADLPELRGLVAAETDPVLHHRMEWAATLTDADVPPEPTGPHPLLHNDLATEHVLVDPGTGRLTGLIDWTDAGFGDPANDFVGVFAAWGRAGLEAALAGYGGGGPGLAERVIFMARVATLHWLHDALVRGEDGARQRRWIDHAFAGTHPAGPGPS